MRDSTRHRAGLVGAGNISEFHVAALRRAGVDIVGVCDIDAARASATAERFGLTAYRSPAELASAGATVLHVLTPPHVHAELALQALDLGCHVLVEKPLAVEADDCQRIEQRATEKGLRVCVNHSLLYDPQVRKALAVVSSGKLGTVVGVDILRGSTYPPFAGGPLPPHYRSAGYPFRDLGVHCLYLLEALLGPIEDVKAQWTSLGGDPNLAFDEWRAAVRCRRGLGQFQLSWNTRPLQSQMVIHGTKGVMRVDLFLMFRAVRKSLPLPKPAERIVNALTDSLRPLFDVPRGVWGFVRKKVLPYHGLQDLVADFYHSLEHDLPVPVTASEATRVVRWTEEVARSADADSAARIEPFTLSNEVPVLVTGASGALGGEIVKRLRARGTRVRVFQRRPPERVEEGVEVALGDLGDPQAVDRAVRGARLVIHAGAAMKGPWPAHEGATVRGTQNVVDACLRHGVGKLLHVSSMSVVDWAGAAAGAVMDESSELEPRAEERGSYTRAKLEAEKLVSAAARRHPELPVVILRPGQIFGGRIPLLTGAVARPTGGWWVVLGNGNVRLPLVYMEDVVDAVLKAAETDLPQGQVIQLVDSLQPTQNEVLRLTGHSRRVLRVPRPIVFALGKLSQGVLGLLKRQSPIAVYRLRSGLARRTFRSRYAESVLGWTPRVGAHEGIRREYGPPPAPDAEALEPPPGSRFRAGLTAEHAGGGCP